jgi:hypothetical protein
MNFLYCDMIRKQHEFELLRGRDVFSRILLWLMLNVLIGTLLVVGLNRDDMLRHLAHVNELLYCLSLGVSLVIVTASTVMLLIVAKDTTYQDVANSMGFVKFRGEQADYAKDNDITVSNDDLDEATVKAYCEKLAEAQQFNQSVNERRSRRLRTASLLTFASGLVVALGMFLKVVFL